MASDYDNSGTTPQLQKTSIHNSTELEIQDHSNEPLSSNLVPNFVPTTGTGVSSLQELDLLFSPLKALYGLKQALKAWYDELLTFLISKGFTKGLQIHQSLRGIFIKQSKYALKILKKHGMDKCDSIGASMATKPKMDADLSETPVDQTRYQSMIRSLMYLTSSRQYIMQAYPKNSGFKLTAFLDADHAECLDTRKSTSGKIQFLGDKPVIWMSKK
ncbi:retrotransposon protein, putative, unclassified [Tanacetum coccineum]